MGAHRVDEQQLVPTNDVRPVVLLTAKLATHAQSLTALACRHDARDDFFVTRKFSQVQKEKKKKRNNNNSMSEKCDG